MKSFVIATAATLAMAGAGFAQGQPAAVPAAPPAAAANVAQSAADQAVKAAEEAAKSAGDALSAAGTAAAQAGSAAAGAASEAADAAMKQAGEAANQAAGAAHDAVEAASEHAGHVADDAAKDAASLAADAADAAAKAADEAAAAAASATANTTPAAPVVAPDVKAPEISAENRGRLGSWITTRHIWTTNQPSTTEWTDPQLTARPAEWQDIARISDIVLDDSNAVVGYIADIGGFLGIGAKKVLLGTDAIHPVTIGKDSFFATNFTKAELEALPNFDENTVVK